MNGSRDQGYSETGHQQPMPIIVGAPRSGTTLLRFMLDSHPQLAIPPETGFLALASLFELHGDALRDDFLSRIVNYPPEAPLWADFDIPIELFSERLAQINPFTISNGYREFYRLYAERFNKPRWGDKTPSYCFHMEAIGLILPEAHFIHIIRDGRDVALSLRHLWFSPGPEMEVQAEHWSKFVRAARRQGRTSRHYMEVQFEELILNTKAVLDRICVFIGLSFDDTMLSYYARTPDRLAEHKSRTGADGQLIATREQRLAQQRKTTEPPDDGRVFNWKQNLTREEKARFEAAAGDLLGELGYEV